MAKKAKKPTNGKVKKKAAAPKAKKAAPKAKKTALKAKKVVSKVKKMAVKAVKGKKAAPKAVVHPKAAKLAVSPKAKGKSDTAERTARSKAVEELPILEGEEALLETEEEVILTDAEGRRLCQVSDCDQVAIVDTYCRYHYLLNWKKIQNRKKILVDNKLENYIEELTARYPLKFLEIMKKDLKTEKDFLAALAELNIDESDDDGQFEEDFEELRDLSQETPARTEEEF